VGVGVGVGGGGAGVYCTAFRNIFGVGGSDFERGKQFSAGGGALPPMDMHNRLLLSTVYIVEKNLIIIFVLFVKGIFFLSTKMQC
jgi:hypothetical protein